MKLFQFTAVFLLLTISFSCKKDSPPKSAGGTGGPGVETVSSVNIYTVADWDSVFVYDFDIKVNGLVKGNLIDHVCDTSSFGNYYVWGEISDSNSAPNELLLIPNFDINDTARFEFIGTDNKVAFAFTLTYLMYFAPDPQIWMHDFYSDSTSMYYNKLDFTDCKRAPKDFVLFMQNY